MVTESGAQVTRLAMGTAMTHKAFGAAAEECLTAVCAEVDRLEQALSRFLPASDISRINRSAGVQCEDVSWDTADVLSEAVAFSARCPGCFAVTIGPLVTLWSRGKQASMAPDETGIRQILPLVNDRDLLLDLRHRAAGLKKVGQSVDLGGIGKGFAGDRIVGIYREYGITSAYSNLGGNVVTVGTRPDGSPWHIGIQHPRCENDLIGAVAVVNQTVVTSGDYQRYFTDGQGKRHHHILDPTTGYPAQSGLISVSVVADRSVDADALSTAVFVAGKEKGLELLGGFPHTEAVLVDADVQVYVTSGLRDRFQAGEGIAVTTVDSAKDRVFSHRRGAEGAEVLRMDSAFFDLSALKS